MQQKWVNALLIAIALFLGFYFYKKYRVAPELELEKLALSDLNGKPFSFADQKGRKTLVCFAASWCGPCRQELQIISRVKDTRFADTDVIVVSDEPVDKIGLFRANIGYPFVWLKLDQAFSTIGINSIPTSYLVNKNGEVVLKKVGFVDWSDKETAERYGEMMEN